MRLLTSDSLPMEIGGKAIGLVRLMRQTLRVPPTIVLPEPTLVDASELWNLVCRHLNDGKLADQISLAVRSSAQNEDSSAGSLAGHYSTVLGRQTSETLPDAVVRVSTNTHDRGAIPVLIQPLVRALVAGVAFSADPITLERNSPTISWTDGTAEDLVSGETSGTTIRPLSDGSDAAPWPCNSALLDELLEALTTLERELRAPVDVEWAVDQNDCLWFLQLRPVVVPKAACLHSSHESLIRSLPPQVSAHSKLRLRDRCESHGVRLSDAIAVVSTSMDQELCLPVGFPDPAASGVSVVLLHPTRVEGSVQREFASSNDVDVPFWVSECRRYSIRRYPSDNNLHRTVQQLLNVGLRSHWLSCVTVQEILDSPATGIVRQLGDAYVAEVAIGHFVPKGIVATTRIIFDAAGNVLDLHRVDQLSAYRIVNGHVVLETEVSQDLPFSIQQIVHALLAIIPVLNDYPAGALEFGLLDSVDRTEAYVIDIAESDLAPVDQLDARALRAGIVSPGFATGTCVRIQNAQIAEVDAHLHNHYSASRHSDNYARIFCADKASIDLLPMVRSAPPGSGFVFRQASILSHLAVVLREAGLPAVVVEDPEFWRDLSDGTDLTVTASIPIGGRSRLVQGASNAAVPRLRS